jgi:hypothetical protein
VSLKIRRRLGDLLLLFDADIVLDGAAYLFSFRAKIAGSHRIAVGFLIALPWFDTYLCGPPDSLGTTVRLRSSWLTQKGAIIARFKRGPKIGDFDIWYEPYQFDDSKTAALRVLTRQPDGSYVTETFDYKGQKVIIREPPR